MKSRKRSIYRPFILPIIPKNTMDDVYHIYTRTNYLFVVSNGMFLRKLPSFDCSQAMSNTIAYFL